MTLIEQTMNMMDRAISYPLDLLVMVSVVALPRKLFPNWTTVSLRKTHDWRIKFKRANKKPSFEQVLHFPRGMVGIRHHIL